MTPADRADAYLGASDRLIDAWQQHSREGASAARIQHLLDEAAQYQRMAKAELENVG